MSLNDAVDLEPPLVRFTVNCWRIRAQLRFAIQGLGEKFNPGTKTGTEPPSFSDPRLNFLLVCVVIRISSHAKIYI